VALPFSRRLARERGWSPGYARRVIDEYKRFAFLAVAAGHAVTPSEAVDEVWHLHLTYTRSYWEHFCPLALGQPLHHEPTRGGRAEAVKFHNLYEETLSSYRRCFGEEPPADIWPAVEDRFGGGTSVAGKWRRWVSVGVVLVPLLTSAGCAMVEDEFVLLGVVLLVYIALVLLVWAAHARGRGRRCSGGTGTSGGGAESPSWFSAGDSGGCTGGGGGVDGGDSGGSGCGSGCGGGCGS